MVSPKVQHFPTPAVRRVAHAPIVAKRLRESSLPPALRGPSGDSPRGACGGRVAHWSCAPEALRRYVPSRPRSRLSGDTASPAGRHVAQTALRSQTRESRKLSAHAWGFIKGFPPAAPAVDESRTGAALQVFPGGMSPASRVIFFREVFYHNPSLVQVYCEQIKYNTITFLKIP